MLSLRPSIAKAMRISLLEKREPFLKILAETLSEYWTNIYGERSTIDYHKKGTAKGNNFCFYGNRYLNFFALSQTPRSVFTVLIKEYGRSPSFIKRPIQQLYVWLATSKFWMPFFAQIKMNIHPQLPIMRNQIILGGNHRIRILTPNEKSSTIILKSGFPRKWIENEINLRRKLAINCSPALLQSSMEEGWLKEDYVEGVPINRLPDSTEAAQLASQAKEGLLSQVILPTLTKVNAVEYIETGLSNALKAIEQTNNLSSEILDEINLFADILRSCIKAVDRSLEIGVSQTHGDFQAANVLKIKTGFTIIDWESTMVRSSTYDLFTWEHETRHNSNFSEAVLASVNDVGFEEKIKHFSGSESEINKFCTYLSFIIDEFTYRIDESCDNLFYQSGRGLESNIHELKIILDYLQTNKIT